MSARVRHERSRGAVRVGWVVLLCALALGLGLWLGTRRGARAPSAATADAAPAAKQLWTCGMHPQILRDAPGQCPICFMDLTPLDAAAGAGGLTIDPVVVQNMGVRVAPVARQRLVRSVRAFGALVEREPDHRDVTLRVGGWIERLFAATDGQSIARGDPLFELYSPELSLAIEELIAARRAQDHAPDDPLPRTLHEAARQRLALLGLAIEQVDELERHERAPATVTFVSPMDGHVTAREVYAGAAVEAGQRVLRLADNARLWVDARVHERELPAIRTGLPAEARVDAAPGEVFRGEVVFVHPHLDMETRTALVRIEVDNAGRRLREGMYAEVALAGEVAPDALAVPREAVIDTGVRRVAFVSLGDGRFEPRDVELGARGDGGLVEVRAGLAAGEMVVVSGQFLLDAESRLREAIRRHLEGGLPGKEAAPAAPGAPAAGMPATEREASQERLDALFRAYLAIATRLGGTEEGAEGFDPGPLAREAHALATDARGETQRLAREIATRAEGLAKTPAAERRAAFGPLSDLAIALADRSPASAAVAGSLYVVHCPMAPGSWLQTHEEVENPYYARTMKACGEVVRTIRSREER